MIITIGITAYNAGDSIECAARSALAQDWKNTEIVIVDDCSADSTFAKISALAEKHPAIRVFRNEENRGVAASRNKIIAEAGGDFIAFFDDDDESVPQRLSVQYEAIRAGSFSWRSRCLRLGAQTVSVCSVTSSIGGGGKP